LQKLHRKCARECNKKNRKSGTKRQSCKDKSGEQTCYDECRNKTCCAGPKQCRSRGETLRYGDGELDCGKWLKVSSESS
ncbi:hypothetical protein EJ02DRAFT_350937, partial [Clathrospora elynae]